MRRRKSIRSHDALCALVGRELVSRGWEVDFFLEYREDGVLKGEMDLFATKKDYALVVEVKETYGVKTRSRAKKQLQRSRGYLSRVGGYDRVFSMFVSQTRNPACIEYLWLIGGSRYGRF